MDIFNNSSGNCLEILKNKIDSKLSFIKLMVLTILLRNRENFNKRNSLKSYLDICLYIYNIINNIFFGF